MRNIEQLEQDGGSFSIETALSQGWKLVSNQLLYYILGGILMIIISVGAGIIPIAGSIANGLIISPCLGAGAVYVTWQIAQGKRWDDFGDMFKGFQFLTPLMVSSLIKIIIMIGVVLVFLFSFIPDFIELYKISTTIRGRYREDQMLEILTGLINAKSILFFMLAILLICFLGLIWSFTTHFIVIYRMTGWKAMELSRKIVMRNFISLLGLYIILGISLMISAVPCGLGLLFTLPWMIGTIYSAFAQITGSNDMDDLSKEGFDFMASEKPEDTL
jgi:uncharacterized membrane protein